LSEDLPVITEIVDEPTRVEAFLSSLQGRLEQGAATLERVTLIGFGG
jgi:uncharacterized protein